MNWKYINLLFHKRDNISSILRFMMVREENMGLNE